MEKDTDSNNDFKILFTSIKLQKMCKFLIMLVLFVYKGKEKNKSVFTKIHKKSEKLNKKMS